MALDLAIKNQLQEYMTRLVNPIKLVAYVDENSSSNEMIEMLEEVASLSEKITLSKEADVSKRIPSFEINREKEITGITFAGIPSGHEFTSFVLALLQASGYPVKIDAEKIEQIKNIKDKFHFETYISLSCHNCPDVVQALNVMSIINPNISHVMIDGALFQKEVEDKQIMAVPTIYLNGKSFGQGRMELGEIVNKIDFHHDYAIWSTMRNAFKFVESLGKKYIHFLEFDNLPDETQYRQSFIEYIRRHDAVIYEYDENSTYS